MWVGALLWCGILSRSGSADEPPAATIPPAIRAAVEGLSSIEFSQRQQAEQTLTSLGPEAFASLVTLLETAPSDAAQRVLLILERIWLQTPEAQADALERQLETLRLTPGPYQPDVARLLFANHKLRQQRAVRALRRLNAVVETAMDENEYELQILMGQPPQKVPERITQIILPRSWKGTEADLWHIQRLAHLKYLTVFVVRGNGISESARQGMQVGFPDIHITERAEVFIGVIGSQVAFDNEPGCRIQDVQPDSPAQIAGLQSGDLIRTVDGQPIKNFDQLVQALKTKRGYQPIELEVSRFGEELTEITVIGVPWEDRRFPSPPPPPEAQVLIDESQIPPYFFNPDGRERPPGLR